MYRLSIILYLFIPLGNKVFPSPENLAVILMEVIFSTHWWRMFPPALSTTIGININNNGPLILGNPVLL